jgi:hypothetical protein
MSMLLSWHDGIKTAQRNCKVLLPALTSGPKHDRLSSYSAMAEAIAVMAAISSIVQLIEFTSKVVARLNSIQSGVKGNPDSLSSMKTELLVLLTTLQQVHNAIKDARMPPKCATALHPTIESYKKLIGGIDATMSKNLPSQGDGKTKALLKSVGNVWGER